MTHEHDADGPTTEFGHDDEYRDLNEQAHPRVPPRLSAPALNWHAAIWNPVGNDQDSETARVHFQGWSRRCADLLVSILDRPGNHILNVNGKSMRADANGLIDSNLDILGYQPRRGPDGGFVLDLPDRSGAQSTNPFKLQTFSCSLLWDAPKSEDGDKFHGQLAKINAELHREYFTFTVWLPMFRGDKHSAFAPCDGPIAAKLQRYYVHLLASLDLMDRDTAARSLMLKTDLSEPPETAAVLQHLYQDIWRAFSNAQLKPFFANLSDKERVETKRQMRTFADFRSIILPSDFPHNPRDKVEPSSDHDVEEKFGKPEAENVMGAMARMLERESGKRAELSGTLLLHRRAVYVSSYGSPPATPTHYDRGRSARYMMVAKPGSRWQLGRLVERLNVIGTYRLAALRNLSQLNAASEEIRAIGRGADEFLVAWPMSVEQSTTLFNDLRTALGDIAKKGCVGGLNYRIERSRYYVESFKRTLPGLRIRRIEGYQPYDEFVSRRYGATWDRISRLGFRYGRLQQRLEFLNGLLNTAQQILQTEEIKKLSEAQVEQSEQIRRFSEAQVGATEQIRLQSVEQGRQTDQIRAQSNTQVDLLEAAELIGILPVTYYTAGLAGSIAESFGMSLSRHGALGDHGAIAAPFIASVYLGVLLWRTGKHVKRRENVKAAGDVSGIVAIDHWRKRLSVKHWWLIGALLASLVLGAFQLGAALDHRGGRNAIGVDHAMTSRSKSQPTPSPLVSTDVARPATTPTRTPRRAPR